MTKTAFAGGVGLVGNGGHGVICQNTTSTYMTEGLFPHHVTTYSYLLDLIELETAYGGKTDLIKSKSLEQKYLQGNYDAILRQNMQLYARRMNEFPNDKNVQEIKNIIRWHHPILNFEFDVPDSLDQGHIFFDRRLCQIRQLAFRKIDKNNRVQILLNLHLVSPSTMLPEDFSALVLHEKLHLFFSKGSTNTLALRQFVGYLSANEAYRKKNRIQAFRLIKTKQAQDFFSSF